MSNFTKIEKVSGVLDLDKIFVIETEKSGYEILEGTPEGLGNDTFRPVYGQKVKLAANPRQYKGVVLHDFYLFTGWDEKNAHRTEYMGPFVQGPRAGLFEIGVAITSWREADEVAYLIEEGTQLSLQGVLYTVRFPKGRRGKFPELVAE